MVTEQCLLRSIIYHFHHQMSHHKPYQSLKQVQQCLKRLNLMNLEKPIQDLIQLEPMNQISENPTESLVPSQPVIEVVMVKILGGCKLVLRLLERCCTAFLLFVKHLCLQEYILLNTLVSGLLSRLWLLYRGVLKSLSSLYKILFELYREVSEIQPRPYIKGFAFPSEIHEFLGTPYLEIKKKMPRAFVMKKAGSGWMNRLFAGSKTSQSQLVTAAGPTTVRRKMRSSQNTIDIGKPVLVNRTNQDLGKELDFDVKTLCKYPNLALQETIKIRELPGSKEREMSTSPKSLKSHHLKSFVSKFQEASSFGELSDALRSTILWCKNNKLRREAFFLGMKLLKSRRLQHVEAQGCRLQRKLRCVKATLCKYLTLPSCRRKLNQMLRAHSHLQMWSKHSRKSTCVSERTPSSIIPAPSDTPGFTKGKLLLSLGQQSNCSSQLWTATNSSNETGGGQIQGDASALVVERTCAHIQEEITKNTDDIDDIFKAIGL
ncbi:nucleolus and neural progenitor protein isoform X2 [Sceloporus undulatus]|nr:nucleolus and neural progenitor protein isoform X2 [Sceloporus undulatus]XP_042312661.1 nucleolus and neural progenitor protein isoform X2 [Sceloporus undulatus]XP_042312663.1 nucleolus and neural progenitor protein isoform X2 [Sceloporus undulatus]XP_042312664.1 nucleolus and neural progenitor protein isoform X2 [Sceloporus undulatus]XP_042312665.1 nucleolus and neural progenitor protein isoform X2 [Sceloporus undulatus]